MHKRFIVTIAAFTLGLTSCASCEAQTREEWSEPFPGVTYMHRILGKPQRIHALIVDLCAEGVSTRATEPGEGPSSVSAFARRVEANVAINGDFYGEDFRPLGLAVGNAKQWRGTRHRTTHGFIALGENKAWIIPPKEEMTETPEDYFHVVSGRPALLHNGMIVAPSRGNLCAKRHPRTAVGLCKEKRKLIMAVVDGRSPLSLGMTCVELAELMKELGAHNALNLDGGGSSTLWIQGIGVVNRPSDGFERPVANHLAIRTDRSQAGSHCPVSLMDPGNDDPNDESINGDNDDQTSPSAFTGNP